MDQSAESTNTSGPGKSTTTLNGGQSVSKRFYSPPPPLSLSEAKLTPNLQTPNRANATNDVHNPRNLSLPHRWQPPTVDGDHKRPRRNPIRIPNVQALFGVSVKLSHGATHRALHHPDVPSQRGYVRQDLLGYLEGQVERRV